MIDDLDYFDDDYEFDNDNQLASAAMIVDTLETASDNEALDACSISPDFQTNR